MKKIISLAVAAMMGFSAMPALGAEIAAEVVLDETTEGVTPEKAIALAKTTFDIPDEMTEFSYDVENYSGGQIYYLSWYDSNYETSVHVNVDSHLVPISYDRYDNNRHTGLSYIRRQELIKSAEDFLRNTVPQYADKFVYSESDSGINRFIFNRYENGVRVENSYAMVYVNKYTGEVNSYSLNWDYDSEFPVTEGISAEKAYDILSDKAVRLEYRVLGGKAIPVYALDGYVYAAMDGSTFTSGGIYFNRYTSNGSMKYAMAEDAVADAGGGSFRSYRLTSEEIAAVEQMNSLISEEKIKEIIASMPELEIPQNYEMTLNYTTNRYDDRTDYQVRISMEDTEEEAYAEMVLNAETGELTDFYSYKYYDWRLAEETEKIPSEQLKTAGEAFISRIKNLEGYRPYERFGDASYVRYVGEIPYPSDYKSVYVSSITGKITQYTENDPRVEIVIPDSLADKLAAVKNSCTVEQVYAYRTEASEDEAFGPVLAWKLNPDLDFYCLRAEDGVPVYYNGEEAEANQEKNDETTHYAWNAFEILRENGVSLVGNYSFDDQITKAEFQELLDKLSYIDVVPYRYIYMDKPDPTLTQPIDRETASRLIARQMSWENVIDLDIFKTAFADEGDFGSGIGAAVILQAHGIMAADENGNFRPHEMLTYGEAYVIIYNMRLIDAD